MVLRCSGRAVPGVLWPCAGPARPGGLSSGNCHRSFTCMACGDCARPEVSISLQILLCIAVVIVAAKLAGTGASRLGLPLVLGELLAGVLLGPSLLDIWGLHLLAPTAATPVSVAVIFRILADL